MNKKSAVMSIKTLSVRQRQKPLIRHYTEDPRDARIVDRAKSINGVSHDPFHGEVMLGRDELNQVVPFGIHHAVGGYHDKANPGDLLCGALAACLDSTIRIIAERLSIRLLKLEIEVKAFADVRGTLMISQNVPIGFQKISYLIDVQPDPNTDPVLLKKLLKAAEHSCVNFQTLHSNIKVVSTLMSKTD